MKTRVFFVLAFALTTFALAGCSDSNKSRGPSSLTGVIDVPNDLEQASKQLHGFLSGPDFNPRSCAPLLNSIFEGVFLKDADFFDRTAIGAGAYPILNNLWLAKLKLRERLAEFRKGGDLSNECVHASRSLLRAIRFTEDYVGSMKIHGTKISKTKRKAFSGGFPYIMLNPNENELELQTGDVLLSRGMAFTSAAIARIGDDDAQFSHLAIVYIDEATKEKYVVEAHIEIGTLVAKFDDYASDGKARALVFRQPDKELAKFAAKTIYDMATKATASGENIPYDFGMDLKDRKELFCSEVVEYAYTLAAKELKRDFKMPLFLTTFSMKNRSFLEGIGVTVRDTFAPADIEVDTRFDLIAEWRDYGRIRTSHYHDAILTEMYRWMEDYGYELRTDPITFLAKNILWAARRWPLFSSLLKKKFPKNMQASAIGTMMLLNDVSSELMDAVEEADKAYQKKTGLWMSMKQLREALEEFRKADLKQMKVYEEAERTPEEGGHSELPPKFHWKFRADY